MKQRKTEMFWIILKLYLLISSAQVFAQKRIQEKLKVSDIESRKVIQNLIYITKDQVKSEDLKIQINDDQIINCFKSLNHNTFHHDWKIDNDEIIIEGSYEGNIGKYKYSKNALSFIFHDTSGLEIEIKNPHKIEFQKRLGNALLNSIIYVPEFLQSFRFEMQKANVSAFDSLGLSSVKAIISCSADLNELQDIRLKKALSEAISTLRNTVYFPN